MGSLDNQRRSLRTSILMGNFYVTCGSDVEAVNKRISWTGLAFLDLFTKVSNGKMMSRWAGSLEGEKLSINISGAQLCNRKRYFDGTW